MAAGGATASARLEANFMILIALSQGFVTRISKNNPRALEACKYNWCAARHGLRRVVASRQIRNENGKQKTILLHRYLLNAPTGTTVDHIDGDPLNNQDHNLRLATTKEQAWAFRRKCIHRRSSSYRGVYWDASRHKWHAQICRDNKRIYLGRFESEEAAARAYDQKAKELFGEFAQLNFPT